MKLNPEQLVVTSFATAAPARKGGAEALVTPYCTYDPTRATECFVCPAPSSPQDGC